MSRENVDAKGRRYLTEGRLSVKRVDEGAGMILAECRGDSGDRYVLGFDPRAGEWRCTCPARGRCAHLVSLQLVTTRPTRGRT